ncbi:MAG: hypothetical protein ACRDJW_13910 [Thermomicrobiales bacterium]
MQQFKPRAAETSDADFLADMIAEAVNWNPDRPRRDRAELLADPAIALRRRLAPSGRSRRGGRS